MNKITFKHTILFLGTLALAIAFTGCMPNGEVPPEKLAGFFAGLWHGWIAPITLVWSFFDKSVAIYEVHNIGWWYDFGYYIAIISGFGSVSFTRKSVNKRRKDRE